MGDRLTGVGLLQSSFDLCEKQKTLHSFLDGSVIGKALYSLKYFLLDRHVLIITHWKPADSPRSIPCHPGDNAYNQEFIYPDSWPEISIGITQ